MTTGPTRPGTRHDAAGDPLIDSLYEIALDPDRYDDLMAAWDTHISAFVAAEAAEGGDDAGLTYTSEIERHFQRGLAILERLGRGQASDAVAVLEADPKPGLLLRRDGRVGIANPAAAVQLGAAEGMALEDLPLDAGAAGAIRAALSGQAPVDEHAVLCVVGAHSVEDDHRVVLALTRMEDAAGRHAARLIAVDVAWSREAARQIAGAFGLTAAELDVAHALVTGDGLSELAKRRKRSLATVRTQAKSLLRKCGLHSQGELIRLFAGYSLIERGPRARARGHGGGFRLQQMTLADGRTLQYGVQGDDGARPVLFVHGMLTGIRMSAEAEASFAARGLKIISPWRASFGGSSPDPRPAMDAPARTAGDLVQLLDHLELEAAPVVGHMSGAVFAFAAAAAHPARFPAVVSLSGAVPMRSWRQIRLMTPRQRVVAYTARYAPRLLPAIVRAGIAQMDSGGMEKFIAALYRNAPADHQLTHDPEIFGLMDEAYRDTIAQGARGFETDSVHVVRDWGASIAACRDLPVLLLHGEQDPVVHISSVEDLVAREPWLKLHRYAGRGHLLLHSEHGDIAERISVLRGNR